MPDTLQKPAVPKLRFPEFKGDWEEKRLGQFLSEHKERVPTSTDIPVFSSSREGLKAQRDYFSGSELSNSGEYNVVPRGFFTYRHMSDDSTFKFNVNNNGYSIVVSREYPVFTTKDMDSKFLNYWLNDSSDFAKFAVAQKRGGTRTRLYFRTLESLTALFPKSAEQRKIAAFLSAVDAKLDALRRKQSALNRYKAGLMQQLFSQTLRFTRPDGTAFPDWEEKTLGSVAEFSKGKGVSKTDISSTGATPCIRYGELYTEYGEVIENVVSRTTEPIEDLYFSIENDVLIPASGESALDIAKASCLKISGVALGGDINVIRGDFVGPFLAYYINHTKRLEIARLAQGNSVVHLYGSQLRKLRLLLPHPDEQRKIADALAAIDDKIQAVVGQINSMEAFKKGLLQQLFV